MVVIIFYGFLYYIGDKVEDYYGLKKDIEIPDRFEISEPSLINYIHFSLITWTTVGYGHLTVPLSIWNGHITQIINILQLLTLLLVVSFV